MHNVTANSKAVIKIKHEETGLEEGGGLAGLMTAVTLLREGKCLQVKEESCSYTLWLHA